MFGSLVVSGLNVDLVDQDQDLINECHNNQGKIIDILHYILCSFRNFKLFYLVACTWNKPDK